MGWVLAGSKVFDDLPTCQRWFLPEPSASRGSRNGGNLLTILWEPGPAIPTRIAVARDIAPLFSGRQSSGSRIRMTPGFGFRGEGRSPTTRGGWWVRVVGTAVAGPRENPGSLVVTRRWYMRRRLSETAIPGLGGNLLTATGGPGVGSGPRQSRSAPAGPSPPAGRVTRSARARAVPRPG